MPYSPLRAPLKSHYPTEILDGLREVATSSEVAVIFDLSNNDEP